MQLFEAGECGVAALHGGGERIIRIQARRLRGDKIRFRGFIRSLRLHQRLLKAIHTETGGGDAACQRCNVRRGGSRAWGSGRSGRC